MFNKLFFLGFFGSIIGMAIAMAAGAFISLYAGRTIGVLTVVGISAIGIFSLLALGKRIAIPKMKQ
jgi:hypothetical protein